MIKIFLIFLLITPNFFSTSLWGKNSIHLSASYHPIYNPGDILFVLVKESTKANQNSKTDIKDESSIETNILGKLTNILKLAKISPINNVMDRLTQNLESQKQTSNSKGEGKITADSTLESSVTVMVKKVLPNGNLIIEGQKTIQLNKEQQIVTLTGVIRPQDVDSNQIESSKIANAKINFTGKGSFDGTKQPGIFQKLMNVLF